MCDQFRKYHIKIWILKCNAKVGKDDIFEPAIVKENLHQINNDNGVRF